MALDIRHIIVCGHTHCGAVKGMLHPEKVEAVPAVARWLSYGESARARTLAALPDDVDEEARVALLTRLNVVALTSLRGTHPSVRAALARGTLSIHGWVYTIETGEVEASDPARDDIPALARLARGRRSRREIRQREQQDQQQPENQRAPDEADARRHQRQRLDPRPSPTGAGVGCSGNRRQRAAKNHTERTATAREDDPGAPRRPPRSPTTPPRA